MTEFHTSLAVFDEAQPWPYRAILASMPTTTGAIVRAVLGKITKTGPAYGDWCQIDADGNVWAPLRVNGFWNELAPLGHITAVRDNFRRLADHCKFSDAAREALFEELRKWVRRDARAQSGIDSPVKA